MRRRRQNHISTAPKAMPTTGPTTTPAIQALLFEGVLGSVVTDSVDCGVLEFRVVALVEVAAMLEDVDAVDVVPKNTVSTRTFDFGKLNKTYHLTELLC